jgi:nitrite reductase/ring-hydroxylating ferredoxin subunit
MIMGRTAAGGGRRNQFGTTYVVAAVIGDDGGQGVEQADGHGVTRRALLASAGAGVAAVGLAACSGGQSGGGSNGGSSGGALTKTSAVPVGAAKVVGGDGQPVVVAQPSSGKFVCHSAICTHAGCTVVASRGLTLECPCHGSVFDAATGAVEQGPAQDPLPAVAVKVAGGEVVRA